MDLLEKMEKAQELKEKLAALPTEELLDLSIEVAGTADFAPVIAELLERDDLQTPKFPAEAGMIPPEFRDGSLVPLGVGGGTAGSDLDLNNIPWSFPVATRRTE